jgi:hypothetical protein
MKRKMLERIDDLVVDPFNDILLEIKEKIDALREMVEYTQAQHLEPRMQNIENDIQDRLKFYLPPKNCN